MTALVASGGWILVVVGTAISLAGLLLLRSYWKLWRHGIETQAIIVRTYGPLMADVRFRDEAGVVHLIEKCLAPRYRQFVVGASRPITYPPGKPLAWEWRARTYHRGMAFFSLYIVMMGASLVLVALQPQWFSWIPSPGPHRHGF